MYERFNRDNIRPYLPSGTLISDEDFNEQIVACDVTCANTPEEIKIANNRADMILDRVGKRMHDLENIYRQFKEDMKIQTKKEQGVKTKKQQEAEKEVMEAFQRAVEEADKKETAKTRTCS